MENPKNTDEPPAKSPNVAFIKESYKDLRLDEFDNARVGRICQTLKCTLEELCAVAAVFNDNRINAFKRKNKWPPEIAVQFYRIESFYLERILKTPTPPGPYERAAAIILHHAEEVNSHG